MSTIDSKIPEGPLAEKWTNYKAHQKLVNPANKRRLDIIVVGTGACRWLCCRHSRRVGFQCIELLHSRFTSSRPLYRRSGRYQRRQKLSKRRRLGISFILRHHQRWRLSCPRSQRLPSGRSIEQHHRPMRGTRRSLCPRIWGGQLANRSFGGAQVSRTFYAKGQTGQQLLLGCICIAQPSGEKRYGKTIYTLRDARPRDYRRSCARYHRP